MDSLETREASTENRSMPNRGQAVLVLAILAVGFAAAYWSVAMKLARDWASDDNYSHGFLVVPLALYFAWERRARLAALASPSIAGLAVLVSSLGVLGLGVLGAELFLQRISLLGALAGTLLFLKGPSAVRGLAFPLAFLILMIPIPAILFNQVAFPLQLLASRFGEVVLAGVGIPVLREGNVITLANITLEVAEACSGIRSLVSLLTLAIVFGYFAEPRLWARFALAAAAVPIAIVANGLRVAGTGVAAHFYGATAAHGFLHTFSGWLVFLVAFGLLFGVQRLLARTGGRRTAVHRPEAAAQRNPPPRAVAPRSLVLRAAIVSLCMLAASATIARAAKTEPVPPRQSFDSFPLEIGGWQGVSADRFDQRTLTALGVDDYVSRIYTSPGRPQVGLYVGFYRSQRQGDTMHSPLNCLPGAGWEPVEAGRIPLAVNSPGLTQAAPLVNRVLIRKGLDEQVVVYWYQSHGRITASEYWGKVYTVTDALRLNRTDAAMIRVMSPVSGSPSAEARAASERAVLDFVGAVFPVLTAFIPK